MRVKGKVAVRTAAARGIGRVMAERDVQLDGGAIRPGVERRAAQTQRMVDAA